MDPPVVTVQETTTNSSTASLISSNGNSVPTVSNANNTRRQARGNHHTNNHLRSAAAVSTTPTPAPHQQAVRSESSSVKRKKSATITKTVTYLYPSTATPNPAISSQQLPQQQSASIEDNDMANNINPLLSNHNPPTPTKPEVPLNHDTTARRLPTFAGIPSNPYASKNSSSNNSNNHKETQTSFVDEPIVGTDSEDDTGVDGISQGLQRVHFAQSMKKDEAKCTGYSSVSAKRKGSTSMSTTVPRANHELDSGKETKPTTRPPLRIYCGEGSMCGMQILIEPVYDAAGNYVSITIPKRCPKISQDHQVSRYGQSRTLKGKCIPCETKNLNCELTEAQIISSIMDYKCCKCDSPLHGGVSNRYCIVLH